VVAPLALWIAAFIVRAFVMMAMRRQVMSRHSVARGLSWGWKATFAAAVAWMLGWVVWLTMSG
jgi:hypothetical protein